MSHTILVFDSGVGGLSVLQEIQTCLPDENYHYLFDNARLPYGELDEAVLIQGCLDLIVPMAKQLQADIVVIACNTASTVILPALRQCLTVPVVGVVPAIKPAVALSRNQHIGLLATPGTIKRHYTHELIREFAGACKVELFGSSELVMLAEQKMAGMDLPAENLHQLLAPIAQSALDVLVLGCTHFPMLKTEIAAVLGARVQLLDSGAAIARRVATLLAEITASTMDCGIRRAYHTAPITDGLQQSLLALGFASVTAYSS